MEKLTIEAPSYLVNDSKTGLSNIISIPQPNDLSKPQISTHHPSTQKPLSGSWRPSSHDLWGPQELGLLLLHHISHCVHLKLGILFSSSSLSLQALRHLFPLPGYFCHICLATLNLSWSICPTLASYFHCHGTFYISESPITL